jgi:hypothetical protein
MKHARILGPIALALAVALGSCILPDHDIQVVTTNPCGEEYAAQTVGAYARTASAACSAGATAT